MVIEADSQYEFAGVLMQQGQFVRAAEEFQRFVFFFPEDKRVPEARLKAARAFLAAGHFQQALKEAGKLTGSGYSKTITANAYFLISQCYQRLNSPTQAIATLHNLATLMQEPAINDQVYYRIGWIYMDQGDWTRAREAFDRISSAQRATMSIDPILADLSQAGNLPRKSPALAGTLSIIPGAGQLYCQRYQDALIAFGINAGLIWAAWESFDEGHEALGAVISFVALGFYMGNIYGAIGDAHKFNRRQAQAFIETMHRRYPVEQNFSYFRHQGQETFRAGLSLKIRF